MGNKEKATMKQDYLKECMGDVGQMPIDQFTKTWCLRCQEPTCGRSISNNLKFDNRVTNWKEMLFEQPPRAEENDPTFEYIRNKRFLPISREPTYEVRSSDAIPIIESNTKTETSRIPSRFQVKVQETEMAAEVVENEEEPTETKEEPIERGEPEVSQDHPKLHDIQNTPVTHGIMIPGGTEEVSDPGSTFVFEDD